MTKRCGYVALLGRPNAGKSTLLNSLVGDKIAVVSRKPQTTRNRILGIALDGEAQLLFLDTPGIHHARGKNLINTTMNRVALTAGADSDIIVYLVDATLGWTDADRDFLGRILAQSSAPFAVVGSKIDAVKKFVVRDALDSIKDGVDTLLEGHPDWQERQIEFAPETVSSKRPEEVAELKGFIAAMLPESEWLFDPDDLTDMPETFVCAELIREQLFRQLGQEIPYGCAVKVDELKDKGDLVFLRARIVVTRKTHKGMVVGKAGSRIKELGMTARQSLERHFNKKVFLELSVGVAEGWIDDQRLIAELAHLQDIDQLLTDDSSPTKPARRTPAADDESSPPA